MEVTALFVVWDSPLPPPTTGEVYLWSGYVEQGEAKCLLRYVEEHGEPLRRDYLAWVRDLARMPVAGRPLAEHLNLGGFSFWWMTRLAERSPWKSPAINDAVRVLALERLWRERRPSSVLLETGDAALAESVTALCAALGVPCRARVSGVGRGRRRWLVLRAAARFARYLLERLPLRGGTPAPWFAGSALLVCSPFVYIDPSQAAKGKFRPDCWDGLLDLSRRLGLGVNWLHYYVPTRAVGGARVAARWAKTFNGRPAEEGAHGFVDGALCVGAAARVLGLWIKLLRAAVGLGGLERAFPEANRSRWLWPLAQEDWRASLFGPEAVENLFSFVLFDRSLAAIPRQSTGVYAYENQAWESALVQAWRKHGHGRLIAVAYATVRFWDLRYCDDPRTSGDGAPRPDVFVLNGDGARRMYPGGEFPAGKVAECEALRYRFLERVKPRRENGDPARLLVMADYTAASTDAMLRMLEKAVPSVGRSLRVLVRPHPNCPVSRERFPGLRFELAEGPLEAALAACDAVYASNLTSGSADAYAAGLSVFVMREPDRLNLSPVRGLAGVRFVASPAELARELDGLDDGLPGGAAPSFFHLDPGLPRWRALLSA